MAVRRISIGPGEIAGYFSRLKSGFDELGIPCEHFVLSANKFSYQESPYFLKETFQRGAHLSESRNGATRLIGQFLLLGVRLATFGYALLRCDVFICSGFTSFFRFRELPLLRLLGKKVLVIYLGSDSRPPIFSGRHLDDAGGYVDPAAAYDEAVRLVRHIRKVEQYADHIVNHTATAQFFSRPFIRFMAVGMPINNGTDVPIINDHANTVRILHAPSRPLAKGSLVFRQIIDELRAEGYSIDFVEVTGVSNSVVLQELQKCDFVVDELYSDVPLAMLATEAAMFGKPVVVGGYYAEHYIADNPDSEAPPTLFVESENIKPAIRKMIDDRDFRLNLGKRAQDFVSGQWSARKVAQNYLRLINGDIPENWIAYPERLEYCWGWGLSKENWRKQVREYVSKLGSDALLLNHNPKLKQRVLNEIQQGKESRSA